MNNNEQTLSNEEDNNNQSEQTKIPDVPTMQDRAGTELKEQHTEGPTESGRVDTEDDSSTNETIGTP